MVSPVVSITHAPLSIYNAATNSNSWATTISSNSMRCYFPLSSVDDEIATRNRRVACACVAPPQDFTPSKFIGPHKIENLSVKKEKADDSDVLIECRDVYKSFGEKHILRGVSFKIRHGEAVGIIGPSGTGKSTILKIMAGLLAPDKGEVFIRGKQRHGLISDEEISGLRIGLRYENSAMPEEQIADLVTQTLAAVGLKGVEDRLPSELSGGMKKRVALARSIIFDTTKDVIEPEMVLYDEPTAGLDPIASTVVEDLIRSVHMKDEDALGEPGKIASYVVVTHQHSTIRRAVDRKVVWQGMTHEFASSINPIVQQFASGCLDGPIRY
ncbi:Protein TRIGALACTOSYLDIACYLGLYCEROL 3, chloroplastic [Castilleja foliolosa]|uniref:Protein TRIGALACTOSYLDIACYLGLYCEROL 3, chloroplastic n=1 Tax=Castilleja foliolosa TaxID=1961234 RepID=A0ABD3ECR8_9LAMI